MSARPRELANALRGITPAALGGLSVDRLIGIVDALTTIGPKVVDVLEGLDDYLHGDSDVDEQLVAAIAKASARNRSGEIRRDLEAELEALKHIP